MIFINALIYLVFFSLILGAYVIKQNRRNIQNRSFALMCLGISMWIFGIYALENFQTFYLPDKLTIIGGLLMVTGFFIFANVFPTATKIVFSWRHRAEHWNEDGLLVLSPLLAVMLLAPFNLFIKGMRFEGNQVFPINGPLFPLFAFVAGFYMLWAIRIFIRQYFRHIGYKRQRIVYVTWSFVFFIVVALISDVVLPAIGMAGWKFLGPAAAGVFLILTGFTMVSYNLMDIRLVLRNVVVGSISLAAGVLVVSEGQKYFRSFHNEEQKIATIIFLLGISTFLLLQAVLNYCFDRYFLKAYHRAKSQFEELNIFLHEEVGTERIVFLANKYFKEALQLQWVYFLDYKRHKAVYEPNENPFDAGLIREDQVYDIDLNLEVLNEKSIRLFYGVELAAFGNIANAPIALLPLWNKGELYGYFLLGPQRGFNGLSAEELQWLQSAWAHLETAFDRALIYEAQQRKVYAQVEDINYKTKKLKKLLKSRLDFSQLASHQLRTPLTRLIGFLQNAKKEALKSEVKEKMSLALEESKKINDLITGILNLAKIEGAEQLAETSEHVSLNEVFASILPVVRAQAVTKDISITYEPIPGMTVLGNRMYLEQSFFNILENAVKCMAEGEILISFQKENDYVITAIKDTGPGIAEEKRSKIFTRGMYSEDNGTGLGLYLVKLVIEAHPEGKVWYESSDAGTTFFIRLKHS